MSGEFHVINLERRTDRWESIQAQFAARDLRPIRVRALEPAPESGKPGWLYCALTHIGILERAREEGWPRAFLVEDDTILTEQFARRFRSVLGWLSAHPGQWDLFNGNPSEIAHVPGQAIHVVHSDPLMVRYEWGKTTNFIVYNRSSYDRIIELKRAYLDPNSDMIGNYADHAYDRMLCTIGLKLVCALPYVTTQGKGYSDLEGRVVDYDPYILERGQKFMEDRIRNGTAQGRGECPGSPTT